MWRHFGGSVLRAICIVAAIVTPSADILNMCRFAAPMIALYAIGIGVAWLVNSTRERSADSV
jgi:sec-independent protein translocase protein TatC